MGVLGEQVSVHLLTDGERGGVGGVSTQEVTEQRRGWKLGAVSKCSPTQYGGDSWLFQATLPETSVPDLGVRSIAAWPVPACLLPVPWRPDDPVARLCFWLVPGPC